MLNDVFTAQSLDTQNLEDLMEKTGLPRLLAKVFLSRGINDKDYINDFLNPSIKNLHDPFLLKDMEKAVARILWALNQKEKITIYGDYDVDGVTSVAILSDFLKSQGADLDFYIPNRCDEGYGMSIAAIDKIKETGTKLIITVDCGVADFEEALYIKESQIDLIITDHHSCKDELPEAYAIVNPRRPDCNYPFKDLAGVGVVFKLLNGLCIKMALGDLYLDYLDLVAVGTVADIVPLLGENRIMVKFGLSKVSYDPNVGISALLQTVGFKFKMITPNEVSFMIAPRVNAAGRVESADTAVMLFTSRDKEEATKLARQLDTYNKTRQDIESKIYKQVVEAIDADAGFANEKVIVVCGEGWHHGIIGIVASKIVEKYSRPCILISSDGDRGRGSGRSIEGFSLFKALKTCDDLLERYGGHDQAVGVTAKTCNIPKLRENINLYAEDAELYKPLLSAPTCIELDEEDLSINSVKQLENLEPFGLGNIRPSFLYRNFGVNEVKTVGEGKHLKMQISNLKGSGAGGFIDAIGFNMGDMAKEFSDSDIFDASCALEINTWNFTDRVQLKLKDIRLNEYTTMKNTCFSELDSCLDFFSIKDDNDLYIQHFNKTFSDLSSQFNFTIDDCIPEREDLAVVYKYIAKNKDRNFTIGSIIKLSHEISQSGERSMNYFKLKKILEIFEELGLIFKSPVGDRGMIITMQDLGKQKVDLEGSILYRGLRLIRDKF